MVFVSRLPKNGLRWIFGDNYIFVTTLEQRWHKGVVRRLWQSFNDLHTTFQQRCYKVVTRLWKKLFSILDT